MYQNYVGRNGNTLYRKILQDVLLHGVRVVPRGKPTLEIQAVTQILEPTERVLTVPGRKANPFFNVAENLAIMGAWQDQRSWLGTFNKNYLQFFDDEGEQQTWAFYGDRLRRWGVAPNKGITGYSYTDVAMDQLKAITDRLFADRSSRQAVATLWHPVMDNAPGHKDYPCNFSVKFSIRDFAEYIPFEAIGTPKKSPPGPEWKTVTREVLHMTVFNRSNDIHWGLFGVNLSQWSFIQEVLAKILGVGVGHQIHISDSLHLYTESEPHRVITENMAQYADGFDIYNYTKPTPMFNTDMVMVGWGPVDRDLKIWKQGFDYLMKGDTVAQPTFPNWPFLEDAWWFLHAYLRRRDRKVAIEFINQVKDNALWVAGVEWMLRDILGDLNASVETEVKRRFPVSDTSVGIGSTDMRGRFTAKQQDVVKYIMSANVLREEAKA